jgi:phage-related protein
MIQADIQKQDPGSIIELFELDATSIGGTLLRFHSGTNEFSSTVYWQGNPFTPHTIDASGFEWTGHGTIPRPHLKVANLTGVATALCLTYEDLVNAKLTRKRTLVKYLDSVNFAKPNLLTYTDALDNAAWIKGSGATITANQRTLPGGGITLDRIVETAITSGHAAYQNISYSTDTYTMSVFAMAGERDWLRIGSPTHSAWFNIATGVIGTQVGCTASIEDVGGSVYRCSIQISLTSGSDDFYICVASADNIGSYAGDITKGIYAGGAQFEKGTLTLYRPVETTQNPYADANAHFQDEVWYVNRKVGENRVFAEFELSTLHDVQGVRLPRRQTIQNVCPWVYKGAECGYVPGSMFTTADVSTANPALDVCGKRLSSCKARFGTYAQLPYGGFPGVGLIK